MIVLLASIRPFDITDFGLEIINYKIVGMYEHMDKVSKND